MKSILFQIALLLVMTGSLTAQEKVQITGTSLKVVLPDGFTVDENAAVITSETYQIAIMEMAGLSFSEQISDFDNIEEKYAKKDITVQKKEKGKLGSYDALFILLESVIPTYQIFLGNNEFCALINVMGSTGTTPIDEAEVKKIFSTIEFEVSTISALEEHANFTISEENKDWEFVSYISNIFSFENKDSENAALILQIPPEALTMSTGKDLAAQVMGQLKENVPNLKIIQEGDWETKNLQGYRMLLEASEGEETGLLYLFVFGNEKAAHVFQGMGSNDEATKQAFENFIKGVKFKE